MNNTSTQSSLTMSFAKVVEQTHLPTKEQAIVLDSIEGHTVQEYTLAMGKLIDPRNILYVSRIRHSRVCFYLSTKELVDSLTESKTKVNIGNTLLEIRPLVSKSKRIILSNVCPIIPNSTIEEELRKLNITPLSQLTPIKAGINDPGFTHILSFRKQMFINPEDISKIPQRLEINHDNTTFYIYLSAEKVMCFLCKEEGHLSKYCKNVITDSQASQPTFSNSTTNVITKPNDQQNENSTEQHVKLDFPAMPTPVSNKRPPPSSSSSTVSNSNLLMDKTTLKKNNEKIIHPKKKLKNQAITIDKNELEKLLEPAKENIMTKSEKYCLDYDNFTNFILQTYGNQNIVEIAQSYTNNFESLNSMLTEVYGLISERKIKARITKIKRKLRDRTETESEYSFSDDTNSIDENLTQ